MLVLGCTCCAFTTALFALQDCHVQVCASRLSCPKLCAHGLKFGEAWAQASGGEGGAGDMSALGAERTSPSFTSAEGSVAEEEGSARPLC